MKQLFLDPKSGSPDDYAGLNNLVQGSVYIRDKITEQNIQEFLRSIVDVTLLQMTCIPFMLMGMAGIKDEFPELFGSPERIKDFVEQFRLSFRQDVVRALRGPKKVGRNKRNVLSKLRNFIRGMRLDELRRFLRFVTGSSAVPKEIQVEFHQDAWPSIRTQQRRSLISISGKLPPQNVGKALKEAMNADAYKHLIDVDGPSMTQA
jgi:hypothetical protein